MCGGTTDLAGYVAPNETCDVYDIISRYYLHESKSNPVDSICPGERCFIGSRISSQTGFFVDFLLHICEPKKKGA